MFREKLDSIITALKSKEIRERIFFSLMILVVFRMLAAVPVAGLPSDAIQKLFGENQFGSTISTVSGGVLETASIVALGLGPYINASIILQLLGSVIPKLEELKKEGSQGRRIISMYTRYLTVPLALMQSFLIYSSLRGFQGPDGLPLIPALTGLDLAVLIVTLTTGAILMMWLGELVTEDGLSNGSSYLIFLGIVAGLPSIFANNLDAADLYDMAVFFGIVILMVVTVILVSEAERRIKVMYSRRIRETGSQENYIPVKITQFGVMPVIFAVSLLNFPALVAQFFAGDNAADGINSASEWMERFNWYTNWLSGRNLGAFVAENAADLVVFLNDPWVQNIGTFLFVVGFSFFYITIVFNTEEYAENLQKQGAFIPGIRPGAQTAKYLRKVSFRLTTFGAIFLGILAIAPNILFNAGVVSATLFSGTGLLILVSVVLDMKRQIDSMVVVRSYDKYI
jgi:preprotein translocase subunit SecY